jgi:hypothetical protein
MMTHIKGISRIDQEEKYNHGWYARVFFGKKRKSKWFADGKFGGKKPALDAAMRWLRRTHKELDKPYVGRRVVTVALTKTKEIGVTRDKSGYLVSWSPKKGQDERVYIPERQGFTRAVQVRRQLRKKMYDNALL